MRQHALAGVWFLALCLSGCGGGNGNALPLDAFNQPAADVPDSLNTPSAPPQDAAQAPTAGAAATASGALISADNAALLTRSTLDILAKLISTSRFVTTMIKDGAPFIVTDGERSGATVDASTCQGGTGGTNRITFAVFQPGHFLPPGKNLHASLSRCDSAGVKLSGFMDLSALQVAGDPTSTGDWRASGILSFSGLSFHNSDGTETFFTNKLDYSAQQANGVLTTTLNIATMNAEHALDAQTHVNYLLEPFYLRTVSDSAASRYKVIIAPPPTAAASILNRYTTRNVPDGQGGMSWQSIGDDIELLVNTQRIPLTWGRVQPDLYGEVPVAGEVLLSDRTGAHSINATVDSGGNGVVILHIDEGATVTSQFADWQTLVSTPGGAIY